MHFDMDQSSILLNEEALAKCPDPSKQAFIYEWLRYLIRILPTTLKTDLKNCQQKLIEQLLSRIPSGMGPPTRVLLAKCITQVLSEIDAYNLFIVVNKCNDMLKLRETDLSTKLLQAFFVINDYRTFRTSLCVLGDVYEQLGRLVGKTYEETFQILVKWIKLAESNTRVEILNAITKIMVGLSAAAYSLHKEAYKLISKSYFNDSVLCVRLAALKCVEKMISEKESPIFINCSIESIVILVLKSIYGSNYEVRHVAGKVISRLIERLIKTKDSSRSPESQSLKNVKDLMNLLDSIFIRGTVGGFLKTTSKRSTSLVNQRHIRIGLTIAYIEAARNLRSKWLDRNLQYWLKHLLELTEGLGQISFAADSTQAVEILFMRKCIQYILHCSLYEQLPEPSQINACKFLGAMLNEYLNKFDCALDPELEERLINADTHSSAHSSYVCLIAIGSFVSQIGSAVEPLFTEPTGIMEPIFTSLLHPIRSARIGAAWCIRSIVSVLPTLAPILIDRCLNRLEYMKKSNEALDGCSLALAGIISELKGTSSHVSFNKCQQIFSLAETMLKSSAQNARLTQTKISSGWTLISAIFYLGAPFVKNHLQEAELLWRLFFPRSTEEAKIEAERGNAFTWTNMLEARAGALTSITCFVSYCPELITRDAIKKILFLVEITLTTLTSVENLLLTHGTQLRQSIFLLRVHLYILITHLKLPQLENLYAQLLRELIGSITICDNIYAVTKTSIAIEICSTLEYSLLSGWQKYLQHGAFEHEACFSPEGLLTCENDPVTSIIIGDNYENQLLLSTPIKNVFNPKIAGPVEMMPMQVRSIDLSIVLFGHIFSLASAKQKLQSITHLLDYLKLSKPGQRMYALQINILSAVCYATRVVGESKIRIECNELKKLLFELAASYISSENALLKCLAIETLGRTNQAISDPLFVATTAQHCFDKLRLIEHERSRTGYALTLGCLHYYVGSLGSGQHLNTAISILLALAQDNHSPTVQAWAILSLSLIASTGGGMFRVYVEPSLSLCLRLLINTQNSQIEVIRAIAKLVSALINSIGPELCNEIMENLRNSFLIACSMLIEKDDVQANVDGIYCIQQFYMFAPRFLQLEYLLTKIINLLVNQHLLIRKTALSCLCQLLQKANEARQIHELSQALIIPSIALSTQNKTLRKNSVLPESGLEGALFEMLDYETDPQIRKHIKDSLLFLAQSTCAGNLSFWLDMCKDILASSSESENTRSTIFYGETTASYSTDDERGLNSAMNDDTLQSYDQDSFIKERDKILPHRWASRVFVFDIVQRIMTVCGAGRAHDDLVLTKELSHANASDYLVSHLSDLIRMSFMAATSENANLRKAGLLCLHQVIRRFANQEEPEYPGHFLLEQFQAQISAALRPAFDADTASDVTAAACDVCSTWICTASGVTQDSNDLRRIHQLLQTSLNKLKNQIHSSHLHENNNVPEKMSILKAWAEVYICAMQQLEIHDEPLSGREKHTYFVNLLDLVNPELTYLVGNWVSVLLDVAILSTPEILFDECSEIDGGTISIRDFIQLSREYYCNCWPQILLASSLWLRKNNFETAVILPSVSFSSYFECSTSLNQSNVFNLIVGICVERFCNFKSYTDDITIVNCLRSLINILKCKQGKLNIIKDIDLSIETINVVHKLILTRDNFRILSHCAELVLCIIEAAQFALENTNDRSTDDLERKTMFKLEGMGGIFDGEASLTLSTVEFCLSLLSRQIPQLTIKTPDLAIHPKWIRASSEGDEVIQLAINLLTKIKSICCLEGYLFVLPSLVYIIIAIIKEGTKIANVTEHITQISTINSSAIIALQNICSIASPLNDLELFKKWESVIRSCIHSFLNISPEASLGSVNQKLTIYLALTMLISTAIETKCIDETSGSQRCFYIGVELFTKFCSLSKECLHIEDRYMQLKTLKCINTLLKNHELCWSLAQELGTSIFSTIQNYVLNTDKRNQLDIQHVDSMHSQTQIQSLTDESELLVVKEAINCFQSMLASAHMTADREHVFVTLIAKTLILFLQTNVTGDISPLAISLNDFSLHQLKSISTHYQDSFKSLLKMDSSILKKIDAATRGLVIHQNQVTKHNLTTDDHASQKLPTVQHPTIKLSTDFSAFKSQK